MTDTGIADNADNCEFALRRLSAPFLPHSQKSFSPALTRSATLKHLDLILTGPRRCGDLGSLTPVLRLVLRSMQFQPPSSARYLAMMLNRKRGAPNPESTFGLEGVVSRGSWSRGRHLPREPLLTQCSNMKARPRSAGINL
jgi:hypothetical protein